jgi:DNA-binding MarR family transcriptional regulator
MGSLQEERGLVERLRDEQDKRTLKITNSAKGKYLSGSDAR